MIGLKSLVTFVAVIALAIVPLVAADSCVQCNSADNIQCVQSPLHLMSTECANSTVFGCFSRIVDGHTIRGCVGSLATDECATSPMCNTCINVNNAQGCNNQPYPEIRLACHECSGSLNSTCATEQSEVPRVCNLFQENDQCFIRRTNESIVRGCMTSDSGRCLTRDHCFICDGHGCNLNVFSDPQIPIAPSSATMPLVSLIGVLLCAMLLSLRA